MKTNYHKMLFFLAAGALILPAYAAAEEKAPVRSTQAEKGVDLRPRMKEMKWKEGANVVYTSKDVKLTAVVKAGQVTRWSATGSDGKPLPTILKKGKVLCQVCVTTTKSDGTEIQNCYPIDCNNLPPPIKSPS